MQASEGWWTRMGSNHRPPACEAGALPLSHASSRRPRLAQRFLRRSVQPIAEITQAGHDVLVRIEFTIHATRVDLVYRRIIKQQTLNTLDLRGLSKAKNR